MNVKVLKTVPAGLVLILAMIMQTGCGGDDPATPPTPPATLASITITPVNPSIAPGTTRQFTATGNYSNGSHSILTSSATWTSSNTAVAAVSNAAGSQGLATAATAAGSTTITVMYSGVAATTALTVSPVASLVVTPASPSSIAPGTTLQFAATGTLADSTVQTLTTWATWNSSNTAIATVSDAPGSRGLATATIPGTGSTTITASCSGATGTATLTTSALSSIAVTPAAKSIARGTAFQFEAAGLLVDFAAQNLTTVATWSTSNAGVATVSNAPGSQGKVTAVNQGTAGITASFTGILSSSATLTVTAATLSTLAVTPVNPSIALGRTRQFTATGTFTDSTVQDLTSSVAWSSTNEAVAAISNMAGSNGLAASQNQGITTIRATLGSVSGATSLTVTPVALESISVTPLSAIITKGSTTQYTAIGNYSNNTVQDLTAQAIWFSSNTFVATISNGLGTQGRAQASATNSGATSITAEMSGIISNAAILTVQ